MDFLSLLETTRPLVNQIPGIISYQIYANDSHYVPKNIISLGVELIFEDQTALDTFMHHPKHFEANALFEKYLAEPGYMVLTHPINERAVGR